MKYSFKEMLNAEIYENTKVMFILGQYTWFNNMVSDTLKSICIDEVESYNAAIGIGEEFGISDSSDESNSANSVDFNTFMDVIGVASVNGKWFCKTDFKMLTKKQREKLFSYIKEPSDNGIIVIVSDDWKEYKDILKNRILSFSKTAHLIQLSFPNRNVLKSIVHQSFLENDIEIDSGALDIFLMKMSKAYGEYEGVIDYIVHAHNEKILNAQEIKKYMSGIEYFTVDDFVQEMTKPMVSDKTNNKKILKMMTSLEDELGAKNLLYQVLKQVEQYIDYRILINSGYIPIGINYFFNDVIKALPEDKKDKYEKVNEWKFRKQAEIASRTSLRDWEYIKIILNGAIANNKLPDNIIDMKCQKALYEACTRSVLTSDRINNIIGIDNIIKKEIKHIDKIQFNDADLATIEDWVYKEE